MFALRLMPEAVIRYEYIGRPGQKETQREYNRWISKKSGKVKEEISATTTNCAKQVDDKQIATVETECLWVPGRTTAAIQCPRTTTG